MLGRSVARSAWRVASTISRTQPKGAYDRIPSSFAKSAAEGLPKGTPKPSPFTPVHPRRRPGVSPTNPNLKVRFASKHTASVLGRSIYHCWSQMLLEYLMYSDDDGR